MDPVITLSDEERAALVRQVMDEFGFEEWEAREFVAGGIGEGDVRFTRPLTPEERREIGVGIGPHSEPAFGNHRDRARKQD